MTLRTYLRILRERWKLVGFVLSLSVLTALTITIAIPNEYEATAEIYVYAPQVSAANSAQLVYTLQQQVATWADLANSPDVLNFVKQDLNLPGDSKALKSKISGSAPPTKLFINITVTEKTANDAALIANSAARGFIKVIEGLNPGADGKGSVTLTLTQPASAPSSPSSPQPLLNLALGVLLGLLIGAALAIVRDVLDTRIKTPEELAQAVNKPTMGVIIQDPKAARHPIATRAGTRNLRAENFRQLRANLQFANVDAHPRVIAITSSVPSEGKTMVALNLASTLAEAGFTVCLVDADLRRPTIAKLMGLPSPVGLTSVLIHQIDLAEAMQNAGSNLYVLSSGPTPPNPSEVLASSYVRDVVRSLLEKVDYVVLDTAPVLPVADGTEVAALADGTLVVARYKVTTESQIKRAIASLGRVDATVLGVVLNFVPNRRNSEYGYTYYRAEPSPHSRRELATAGSGRSFPWSRKKSE